jgi:CHAD domain-containing protein
MAEKPAVRPDVAVGEALRAVARDVLSEARAALDDTAKTDAVAVHDYRKAMKRWRALLRLLEPFLGDEGRGLRTQARDSAKELAGARDAQSGLDALDDMTDDKAPPLSVRTVASIRGRLDEIRRAAEADTLNEAARARLIIALDGAASAADTWPLDDVTFSELARELTENYQMELVEPLWPKFGRLWVAEAQRLRDRLGAFQDLSVLQGFTAPHGPLAPWRSRLAPLILARRAAHAKAAQRMAGRLFAEKPRAFRRRLEALWDSGKR